MTDALIGEWRLRLTPAEADLPASEVTLTIARPPGAGAYSARLGADPASQFVRTRAGELDELTFRCRHAGQWEWYHLRLMDSVLTGRYASAPSEAPPDSAAYPHFVTGWNMTVFDRALTPRAYELIETLTEGAQTIRRRATLRLDQDVQGRLLGRYKRYATQLPGQAAYQCDEALELDVTVIEWDGARLCFAVSAQAEAPAQTYTGTLVGGVIHGTVQSDNPVSTQHGWQATRAGVLGFGITPKPPRERAEWQARSRRRLTHLVMAGGPLPRHRQVNVLQAQVPPAEATVPRDDDPERHPQDYHLTELELLFTLTGPAGQAVSRRCHAWLATPDDLPTGERRPAALCLNGHRGSAHAMFFPRPERMGRLYWYGDAFARRGYVVLALDVSHRPPDDRRGLYRDYDDGDDPLHGNYARPAIQMAGGNASAWEEPGERAWDVIQAHDYLRTLPGVDPERIVLAGLSMGGEVATLASALDPRFAATIATGYSPDLGVMALHGNHACWQWQAADMRAYVEVSDLHALIAPRALMVQTSQQDRTFSAAPAPYAADKQVTRRTQAAYADSPGQFVHYLHDLRLYPHEFCFGDVSPDNPRLPVGVEVARQAPPAAANGADPAWQADGAVFVPPLGPNPRPTLFDYLDAWLAPGPPTPP